MIILLYCSCGIVAVSHLLYCLSIVKNEKKKKRDYNVELSFYLVIRLVMVFQCKIIKKVISVEQEGLVPAVKFYRCCN